MVEHSSEKSDAYFSPGETCRAAIIHEINSAVSTLKVCVFTISDDQIAAALLAAHRKGIDVKILTDNDKLHDIGSDIKILAKERMQLRIDNTTNHMHHKFMIKDEHTLLTGSYNWTNSAARYNHENIVVTNNRGLVNSFLNEFEKLWQKMGVYVYEEVRNKP